MALRFNPLVKGLRCRLLSHFYDNPLSCIGLSVCSSSLNARSSVFGSYSTTSVGAQGEGKCKTIGINDENDGFEKMGSGELCITESANGDGHLGLNFSFGSFDTLDDDDDDEEEEEEEEEEDSEGERCSDDEGLEFISSSHGNQKQGESIGRVEIDEHEFRHPLVREVCRLIALRSAWNPRLEAYLGY